MGRRLAPGMTIRETGPEGSVSCSSSSASKWSPQTLSTVDLAALDRASESQRLPGRLPCRLRGWIKENLNKAYTAEKIDLVLRSLPRHLLQLGIWKAKS